jgi:uncharacterized membrane protein YhaH (DUF805 family)
VYETDGGGAVRGPPSTRKIQVEGQQTERYANGSPWHDIVYPGRNILRPFYEASVLELVLGVLTLIGGGVLLLRIFFISDENKSRADELGLWIIFGFVGLLLFFFALFILARFIKYIRESSIYVLPNGFPVTYRSINADYKPASPFVLGRPGYFDVEQQRAGNPIVAPGEITTTNSPSFTYAPSSTREVSSDDSKVQPDELLTKLLAQQDDDHENEGELPTEVDLFDYMDEREAGNILIGVDANENVVQMPILKMFNHLVGGAIGTGKSIYMRSLVYQLLVESQTASIPIQIGLADIENNTFPEFNGCRNVQWYASNYVEIEHMTNSLLAEG